MRALVCSILFLVFTFPHSALAHPQDFGVLEVKPAGERMQVTLQLNPVDTVRIAGIALPPPAGWPTRLAPRIFFATLGKVEPALGGQSCRWRNPSVRMELGPDGEHVSISAQALCPASAEGADFSLPLEFLKEGGSSFKLVGAAEWRGRQLTLLVRRDDPTLRLSGSFSYGFLGLVHLGAEHIGATPNQWHEGGAWRLPEGLDHIVFVLALVLGGGSLLGLIKSVSGFTLGHSLTLLASTLHWVSVPSRAVEIGIALSIAGMALPTLLGRSAESRWRVAAAFGLLHGLGFSSALRGLQLGGESLAVAVLGFNLGVELAQLLVVALAILPLWWLRRSSEAKHRIVVRGLALLIALSGVYWAGERIFS